jgi:flagellar motor protein MotB
MFKIQSSQKFILAMLAFSSITASTIFPATANIFGSQFGFDTQHQSAKFKISQSDIGVSNGYFTPEQEAKMLAIAKEFNEKITNLQQQHSSDNPAARQQMRNITREYFLGMMSILTPAQREQFKRGIDSETRRELGLN